MGVLLTSLFFPAGDRYDSSDTRGRWDDDWEKNKGPFPFSDKLGEISDKIGSTIDDTISRFRKKERDDSPDRFRLEINEHFGKENLVSLQGLSVFIRSNRHGNVMYQ